MLQHFQVHPIHLKLPRLGWNFSFFYQQQRVIGHYDSNGAIHINTALITAKSRARLEKMIHDLMIYHIYDQER